MLRQKIIVLSPLLLEKKWRFDILIGRYKIFIQTNIFCVLKKQETIYIGVMMLAYM